jgi:glycosyltransferase involved in cell wall biosynthesis
MRPHFSVVIPLYNKSQHIANTLNSVLCQNFDDFEIIIIDDGSTDGGGDVVAQINDDRITLIHQVNSGVSVARNCGVDQSKGEYVAFLDADDEWLPWHLDELDGLIKEFPDCGIYSVAHYITQGGIKYYPSTGVAKEFRGIIDHIYTTFSKGLALINSSTACVKKDAFYRSGCFPVGITRGEDVYIWLKIANKERLAHSSKVCVQYNKDAVNRSNHEINIEIPYYCIYLDELFFSEEVRDDEKRGMLDLLFKGVLYTAAGYRVDGCMSAFSELKTLQVVKQSFILKLALMILRNMPTGLLIMLRKRRHSGK